MTKNPLANALGAAGYIVLVVVAMTVLTQPLKNKPDTLFAPMVVLFVLTLSVAVMAYVFFYQPLLYLLEGKKKEALDLFVKTVACFGVITVGVLMLMSVGII